MENGIGFEGVGVLQTILQGSLRGSREKHYVKDTCKKGLSRPFQVF